MAAVDYNSLTVVQLKELLDERGIEYKAADNKAALIERLEE